VRKLVGLVVALGLLVGIAAIVDVVVRDGVEVAVADHIEARSPGSHATVHITSFPFLGHLAVSGTVPSLAADVSDVRDGNLMFRQVDLDVTDLRVDRSRLVHGDVQPVSIRRGQVTALVTQASLDSFSHLPLTLGQGTVSAAGITVKASVTITGDTVVVDLGRLPGLSIPVPSLDVLPCVGAARVVPGALRVSCTFTSLPGALAHTTFHA
jgi:hypothetical protein